MNKPKILSTWKILLTHSNTNRQLNTIILCLTFAILVTATGNSVLAQIEEKTFTSSKFGLKMNYPSDWTFIATPLEFQEFTPGIYDYSAMIPPGQASIGKFCADLGNNPESSDCELKSPAYLKIDVFRLVEGTTLREFYEGKIKGGDEFKDLIGEDRNVQTSKTNISGLSAIQKISTSGKGSMDRLLDEIGQANPTSKYMTVYFVNDNTGFTFFGSVDDQKTFDDYLPLFEKMLRSVQIEGAIENPENANFVPELNNSSSEDEMSTSEDLVLLSHKLKKGDGDYNDLIGQVKNIGSDTLDFVKIGVNVYDKDGDIVGTDSTYAESSTLEQNQKSSFDIFASKDNFEGMATYELSLSWQTSDGEDKYVDNAQIYKDNTIDSKD